MHAVHEQYFPWVLPADDARQVKAGLLRSPLPGGVAGKHSQPQEEQRDGDVELLLRSDGGRQSA